jgi:hypothetical protein
MISFFVNDKQKLGRVNRVSITAPVVAPATVKKRKKRGLNVVENVVKQKPLIQLVMDDYTM